MSLYRWSALLLLGTLVAACATEPEPDELHFGESVRHMISVQTYKPGEQAPPLDGEKADAVIRGYRADTENSAGAAGESSRMGASR